MARGKYITKFEEDCIKSGFHHKVKNATIARALNRTKQAIGRKIKEMQEDGTINDVPLYHSEIAEMLLKNGAI
ncbi:hypothetical protein [Celeribacter baekdonensis]|uniref:hypothetical protein n=1 Tax=Pseudomonadota TaxID=1224 RepID=UPI003A8D29C0